LRDFTWSLKRGDLPARDVLRAVVRDHALDAGELEGASEVLSIHPVLEPLLHPFRLTVRVHGPLDARLCLYRDSGEGWEWIGADYDAQAHTLSAETRRFGRFALFRDREAPRIALRAPPRAAAAGPYPRWALEAHIGEQGSGVVVRDSHFIVDGRRVASEWDAVESTLRWRPPRAPAGGRHKVEVVVADRAGNVGRRHGTFVLD
jgi:hypothetical protein